jgi:ribonuclease HI
MTPILIFTDGSSKANGKPECIGGWSMVIPNFQGKMFVRYGQLPAPSSNNKAEIMGVLYALSIFSKSPQFKPIIHSDSQYVVKSCNEWRYGWAKSNYEGIKNRALLVPLFELIDKSINRPDLQWVKGHAGNHGNELADEFAGLGKSGTIRDKNDAVSNIRYVPYEELPYDLVSP